MKDTATDRWTPDGPWAMFMRWHDLLFAHWPIDLSLLRPFVPDELEIETHEGSAWVGVVPFRMSHVRPRLLPPLPGLSAFPELNVRTYVRPLRGDGRPGVWFFSLDAASRAAVIAARRVFHLPYIDAHMRCRREGGWVRYASRRTGPHTSLAVGEAATRRAELVASYRPIGPVFRARAGTLEHFLTHRLCLYAYRAGGLIRGDIDHAPWPLQNAEWLPERNTMLAQLGIFVPTLSGPALTHFARRLDVRAWLPRAVGEPGRGPQTEAPGRAEAP